MVKTSNLKDKCPRCGKGSLVTDANTGEKFLWEMWVCSYG